MANYSKDSQKEIDSCTNGIQVVFGSVIKTYDNKAIQGHRTIIEQQKNFDAGKTTTMKSKHLLMPSKALDASPYPIPKNWGSLNEVLKHLSPYQRKQIIAAIKEHVKFYHFAGYVQGQAELLGYPLRWGGDWDGDKDFADQKFDDLVHFEEQN